MAVSSTIPRIPSFSESDQDVMNVNYAHIAGTFKLVLEHPYQYLAQPITSILGAANKIDPETDALIKLIYTLGGRHALEEVNEVYFTKNAQAVNANGHMNKRQYKTPQERLGQFAVYLEAQSKALFALLPQHNETVEQATQRRITLRKMGYTSESWLQNMVLPFIRAEQAFFAKYGINRRVRKVVQQGYVDEDGNPVTAVVVAANQSKTYHWLGEPTMVVAAEKVTPKNTVKYMFQHERDQEIMADSTLSDVEKAATVAAIQSKDQVSDRAKSIKRSIATWSDPFADGNSVALAVGQASINVASIIPLFKNLVVGVTNGLVGGFATTMTNFVLVLDDNRKNLMSFAGLFIGFVIALVKGPSKERIAQLEKSNNKDDAKRIAKEEHNALLKKLLVGWLNALAAGLTKKTDNPWLKGLAAIYAVGVLLPLGVLAGLGFAAVTVMSLIALPTMVPFIPVMAIAVAAPILGVLGFATALSLGSMMYGGAVNFTNFILNLPNEVKEFYQEWKDRKVELKEIQKKLAQQFEPMTRAEFDARQQLVKQQADLRLRQVEMFFRAVSKLPLIFLAILPIALIGGVATFGAVIAPIQAFMLGAVALFTTASMPMLVSGSTAAMVLGVTLTNFIFNINSAKFVLESIMNGLIKGVVLAGQGVVALGQKIAQLGAPKAAPVSTPAEQPAARKKVAVERSTLDKIGINLAFAAKQLATLAVFVVLALLVVVNAFATGAFSAGGKDSVMKLWDFLFRGKITMSPGVAMACSISAGSLISAGGNGRAVYGEYQKEPSYYFFNSVLGRKDLSNERMMTWSKKAKIDDTLEAVASLPSGAAPVVPNAAPVVPNVAPVDANAAPVASTATTAPAVSRTASAKKAAKEAPVGGDIAAREGSGEPSRASVIKPRRGTTASSSSTFKPVSMKTGKPMDVNSSTKHVGSPTMKTATK